MLQSAAPIVAGKIKRIVFLNAFILPDGTCQFDLVPSEAADALTAAAQATTDGSVHVVEDMVRGVLMGGDSREAQDGVMSRLSPQPLVLFTTKVDTKPFSTLDTPKSVVLCRDDTSLPPGAFLAMAEGLGEYELIEISGGHEALVTDPAVVADGILQAAHVG